MWSDIIDRMLRYGSRLSSAGPEGAAGDAVRGLPQAAREPAARRRTRCRGARARPASRSPSGRSATSSARCTTCSSPPTGSSTWPTTSRTGCTKSIRAPTRSPSTGSRTARARRTAACSRARLRDFPKHDSTSNAHSLAESRVDGHIFITPSAQRRLVEFDPATKAFTLHEMDEGFYPHTIRVDQKDRVWFTVALSNQVAMFDRDDAALHDVRPADARLPRVAQRAADRRDLQADELGRAARQLAAGGPPGHRHAAALRHRHHARRQGVVRAPAHRRDRLDRSRHAARSR